MADQKDFMDMTEELMDSLYSYARRLTRNDSDAEDLLQDTYFLAYRGFDKFSENTNIKAWMYKIMTNSFLNSQKKKKQRPELDNRTIDGEMSDVYMYDSVIDPNYRNLDSAEAQFLSELPDEEIKAALESIPSIHRIPILLADIEGFSYQDIADFLDVPSGTIMSRLHRGRKTLFEELYDIRDRYGYGRGKPEPYQSMNKKRRLEKAAVS